MPPIGGPPSSFIGIGAPPAAPRSCRPFISGLPRIFLCRLLIAAATSRPDSCPAWSKWLSQHHRAAGPYTLRMRHAVAGHAYVAPDEFSSGPPIPAVTWCWRAKRPRAVCARRFPYLFRSLAELLRCERRRGAAHGHGQGWCAAELKDMRDQGANTARPRTANSSIVAMACRPLPLELGAARPRLYPPTRSPAPLVVQVRRGALSGRRNRGPSAAIRTSIRRAGISAQHDPHAEDSATQSATACSTSSEQPVYRVTAAANGDSLRSEAARTQTSPPSSISDVVMPGNDRLRSVPPSQGRRSPQRTFR